MRWLQSSLLVALAWLSSATPVGSRRPGQLSSRSGGITLGDGRLATSRAADPPGALLAAKATAAHGREALFPLAINNDVRRPRNSTQSSDRIPSPTNSGSSSHDGGALLQVPRDGHGTELLVGGGAVNATELLVGSGSSNATVPADQAPGALESNWSAGIPAAAAKLGLRRAGSPQAQVDSDDAVANAVADAPLLGGRLTAEATLPLATDAVHPPGHVPPRDPYRAPHDRHEEPSSNESRSERQQEWPPKVFWALAAALVCMICYILCIPFILTIAKRRRNTSQSQPSSAT